MPEARGHQRAHDLRARWRGGPGATARSRGACPRQPRPGTRTAQSAEFDATIAQLQARRPALQTRIETLARVKADPDLPPPLRARGRRDWRLAVSVREQIEGLAAERDRLLAKIDNLQEPEVRSFASRPGDPGAVEIALRQRCGAVIERPVSLMRECDAIIPERLAQLEQKALRLVGSARGPVAFEPAPRLPQASARGAATGTGPDAEFSRARARPAMSTREREAGGRHTDTHP